MNADSDRKGPVIDVSDRELMVQLAAGDMRSLEVIYMRYGAMARTAIRRTDPRMEAADVEELLQDVFLQVAQSATRFDPERSLKPWVYGIAVNLAAGRRRSVLSRLRLLRRHHESSTVLRETSQGAHEALEQREEVDRVLSLLPAEQYEVMVLHAVEGFRGEEIAEILGIRVNTVWTRLHRARQALQDASRSQEGISS
jgi:RNA polymerase sigma-70 factor, ECF subfamily